MLFSSNEDAPENVVKFKLGRVLRLLARMFGMTIHPLDLKTAFYTMEDRPRRLSKVASTAMTRFNKSVTLPQCYKLKKSIHGLKQAGRLWNELLD